MKKCIVGILLFALGLCACAAPQDWDSQSWFPLWEDAGKTPDDQESLSMKFVAVEPFDMEYWTESIMGEKPDEDWSMLHMKLHLEEETIISPVHGWRIDFYYDGAWHTVYREKVPVWDMLVVQGRLPGEHDAFFAMPAQVLQKPGEYRLCYENHGTFPFNLSFGGNL